MKNILVIDDDRIMVRLVRTALEKKGYTVTEASNGLEGLQRLSESKPDLIILDINMPKMGGLEFYNRICGTDMKPEYPVFVLTAREDLEQLFREFYVDGFMTKPFEIEYFLREIEIILARRSHVAQEQKKYNWRSSRNLCIVENNLDFVNRVAMEFLSAGYIMNYAQNGVRGMEKVLADLPDLVLINYNLNDIPSDTVILKLRYMPKTSDVRYILYYPKGDKLDPVILDKIATKCGLDRIVQFGYPKELLDVVKSTFEK